MHQVQGIHQDHYCNHEEKETELFGAHIGDLGKLIPGVVWVCG
jgi:hypothetical protein